MNLILQIDDNTAHAVDLGSSPTAGQVRKAADMLLAQVVMPPKLKATALASSLIARHLEDSKAPSTPYPYSSHRDYAGDEGKN